ncbi:MAG: hypothetical protein LCI03_15410 [Actinobacteria bacterium]|jgi:hypothetical protein|nr:hypothetical protein [Actinomycetota bacterium]
MWVAMLVLAGLFVGGVISFVRQGRPAVAVLLGLAAAFCLAAAWVWLPKGAA